MLSVAVKEIGRGLIGEWGLIESKYVQIMEPRQLLKLCLFRVFNDGGGIPFKVSEKSWL